MNLELSDFKTARWLMAALVALIFSGTSFAGCIQSKDADNGSYTLQNTCNYSINVKYTFSSSKPFNGAYTTLMAKQSTFDSAKPDESAKAYECATPGVPQTITGGCVGGKISTGAYWEREASEANDTGDCIKAINSSDGSSYILKNTCKNTFNVKYTFSITRPMSGTYTTLRANESTLDQARNEELAKFYSCSFPGVPQTVTGGCVGGSTTKGTYGERPAGESKAADKEAKERAEAEKLAAERAEAERRAQEAAEATRLAEEKRQQDEIDRLVSGKISSGDLRPGGRSSYSSSGPSVQDSMVQLQTQLLQQQILQRPQRTGAAIQGRAGATSQAATQELGCDGGEPNCICVPGTHWDPKSTINVAAGWGMGACVPKK